MTSDPDSAPRQSRVVLRAAILGYVCSLVLGTLLTFVMIIWVLDWVVEREVHEMIEEAQASFAPDEYDAFPDSEFQGWPPPEYDLGCPWVRLRIQENTWKVNPVGTYEDLDRQLQSPDPPTRELAIPIFPTVYVPIMEDNLYYDAILASDMGVGDKVLVVGTGSGADAWVAWSRTQSPVYVVEINPMAVVNARATARLAGFELHAVTGDITKAELPEDFSDFDYVLWNMPFMEAEGDPDNFERRDYHDGDNGKVLKDFQARLPALLKPGGKAIILNSLVAEGLVTGRIEKKVPGENVMVFVIANH